MNSTPAESTGHDQQLPSGSFRTVASFLIFVHLFALGVVVSSNWGPQSEPSQLRRDVRGKLWPLTAYMQLLHMDTGYNFYYTYGDVLDVDHLLFADLSEAQSDEARGQIRLPEKGLWPGLRRRRFLRLNLAVASQVENQAVESLFPTAAADYLLDRYGAEQALLRYQALLLQRPEDVGSSDPAAADPYDPGKLRTVYEARAWLDNGEVQLLKTTIVEGQDDNTAPAVSAPAAPPES